MTTIINLLEGFDHDAHALLEKTATVQDIHASSKKELLEQLKPATVLLTGLSHAIDQAVIDSAPDLKIIATPVTGLDHIDTAYAESKKIRIISLRGETEFLKNITGTAELAWGLLLALVRNIVPAAEAVKDNQWNRNAWMGHSLAKKTLGIAGVGRLGKMVAAYGKAFGMNVIGFDRTPDFDAIPYVSFNELLAQSDILSIHLPLNDETSNMFDMPAFKQMKPSAVIINTARGAIVNEADMMLALNQKIIAGYATDVISDELSTQTRSTHPLIDYAQSHANVLITPHIGGMTVESRSATDMFIAEKIRAALA